MILIMTEQSAYNSRQRNIFLDVAKSIAIILVIIGHEFMYHSGMETLPFRVIYSFHMAFFMFISGMVFSIKFKALPSPDFNTSREIMKSAMGLLVPFVSWTLIYAFTEHRDSVLQYLLSVVESPDNSLWFLLVLFWFRIFFVTVHWVCIKCFGKSSVISLVSVMIVIFGLVSVASKLLLPRNFLGCELFRTFFPHFAAGVFMYQYRERLSGFLDSISVNTIMIIIFILTAPFYYNVSPNPFETTHGVFLFKIIIRIPAIPGIFLMMSLTKLITRTNFKPVINALSFTGKMTMGIYVFHWYFLKMFPPFIVPFLASIVITVIVEKIPLLRSLLLGK